MADLPPREEMDFLAAEYVLGVQDAEDRARTRALIEGNGTMRLLLNEWEFRLAALNAAYVPVAAPDVWGALDAQLFARGRRRNRLFWLVAAGLGVLLFGKIAMWWGILR